MPIYLCQPGTKSKEPWRHGVQVYARPFALDNNGEASAGNAAAAAAATNNTAVTNNTAQQQQRPLRGVIPLRGESSSPVPDRDSNHDTDNNSNREDGAIHHTHNTTHAAANSVASAVANNIIPTRRDYRLMQAHDSTISNSNSSLNDATTVDTTVDNVNSKAGNGVTLKKSSPAQIIPSSPNSIKQPPVRRVRHAEVVLVDQVLIAHERYWLRLRWPGQHGGFGGFVALGRVADINSGNNGDIDGITNNDGKLQSLNVIGGAGEESGEIQAGQKMIGVGVNANGVEEAISAAAAAAATMQGRNEKGQHDDKNGNQINTGETTEGIQDSKPSSTSQTTTTTTTTLLSRSNSTTTTKTPLLCLETNVHYPTSLAMKLLPLYDDSLNNTKSGDGTADIVDVNMMNGDDGSMEEALLGSIENGEPVFCRICREGLHDVNYDLETATTSSAPPSGDEGANSSSPVVATRRQQPRADTTTTSPNDAAGGEDEGSAINNSQQQDAAESSSTPQSSSQHASLSNSNLQLSSLPPLILHHPTAENPLLAPCECSGTMAFVHYLCIEQWRCRSRHPAAKNGLHCETCGAEYTLPPPPSRPASRHDNALFNNNNNNNNGDNNLMPEDDWLDAMPPHVLAALRRPHPWWQLGAAIVRRRYLRPLVPVFLSPLVALYCRARRTLKKRGVSRRRWACSLCRRRARWKCVRCLRSYYCSRQCQNVSWHIVHKHVCYKPARFWWSVVVYSLGGVMAVPGVLKDPLVYDFMLTFLPINFMAVGIIGGGIATDLKRFCAIDIRGRILESVVVLLTLWLTSITCRLVRGFFGDASQCWGVFAPTRVAYRNDGMDEAVSLGDIHVLDPSRVSFFSAPVASMWAAFSTLISTPLLFILQNTQVWFQKWDHYCFSRLGFLSRRFICTPTADGNTDYLSVGCFPSVRNINPHFFLDDGGETCQADMSLMLILYVFALGFLAYGSLDRHRRGRARNVVGHRGRNERRPHQD